MNPGSLSGAHQSVLRTFAHLNANAGEWHSVHRGVTVADLEEENSNLHSIIGSIPFSARLLIPQLGR